MRFSALLVLAALALGACSSSATPGGSQPTTTTGRADSSTSPSTSTDAPGVAACEPASQDVVTDVAGGLKKPARSLTGSFTVATTASERATGEKASVILAARVVGGGNAVGTWAYSEDGIDALNHVAQEYSEWGAAAQPGSPALKAREAALRYPETVRATACAGAGKPGGAIASIGANRCGFPPAPDVIYWFETPGEPATAQLLGAYDLGNCTKTADQAELDKTSPQGSGFCTIVAATSANPGYDVDATPASRPKGVLAESGAGC